jgi:serine/threonine protein kinase/tetratricopeptide (TPR) repeat protein
LLSELSKQIAALASMEAHLGVDSPKAVAAAPREADPFATLATPATEAGSLAKRPAPAERDQPRPANWPEIRGYQILGELGHGGMGVVYKARHLRLNRVVALKMVLAGAQASPEDLLRFLAEAENIAQVQHPNIVQVHEIGQHGRVPYFAMEYLAGGSLSQKTKGTPVEAEVAARLVEMLARGVHAAHQRGIIHRDLKPANVLLQIEDGRLQTESQALSESKSAILNLQSAIPKITDFGLAKRLEADSGLTRTGQLMGTPSYMPPEQARGQIRKLGPTCDVYALGAILYEMLTGRPPFRGTSVTETLDQVVNQEVVPPSRLRPKLDRDLETICLKCLQKEQDRRYATAEALAQDLGRFLAREPIAARRPSPIERLRKWARRKPASAALIGAIVVAVLGIVMSVVLYVTDELRTLANQQENREEVRASLVRAQAALLAEPPDLETAKNELVNAKARLGQAGPAADELAPQVQQVHAQVQQAHNEAELKRQKKQGKEEAMQRLALFDKHYGEALFLHTLSAGFGIPDDQVIAASAGPSLTTERRLRAEISAVNTGSQPPATALQRLARRQSTSAAALRALSLYRLDKDNGPSQSVHAALERDREYCDPSDAPRLDRTCRACYELLLIYAETVAPSVAGDPKGQGEHRQQAQKALAILERAGELGAAYKLEARTCHRHKNRYLAIAREEKSALASPRHKDPAIITSVLDGFLEALEHYRTSPPQLDKAMELCAQVLRAEENHFGARYLLALCHLKTQGWAQAKAELTVCLNLHPEFAWPRVLRGFAETSLGFAHAGRTSPAAASEYRAAEDDLTQALKQDRDELVQYIGLCNRGVLYIRRKLWRRAEEDLRKAVALRPDWYQAYVNLSHALQGAGAWPLAEAEIDKAVKLSPLPELYEMRAFLHLGRNRVAQARPDLERVIDMESKGGNLDRLAKCRLALGWSLDKEGEHKRALKQYDSVVMLKPKPEFLKLAQRLRAMAFLKLEQPSQAGAAVDSYLSLGGEADGDVYYARGLIYEKEDKLPDAIKLYTLALQRDPQHHQACRQRGWVYVATQALQLAAKDFDSCVRARNADGDALIGRGYTSVRLRQVKEGLLDAARAEEEGALTDRLWYYLARIYAHAAVHFQLEARPPEFPGRAVFRTAAGLGDQRRDYLAKLERSAQYKRKACVCLEQSLKKMAGDRQRNFWLARVEQDKAFLLLRDQSHYIELRARYGGTER